MCKGQNYLTMLVKELVRKEQFEYRGWLDTRKTTNIIGKLSQPFHPTFW